MIKFMSINENDNNEILTPEAQFAIRAFEVKVQVCDDISEIKTQLINLIEDKYIKIAQSNKVFRGEWENEQEVPITSLPLENQVNIQNYRLSINSCSDITTLKEYLIQAYKEMHMRNILLRKLVPKWGTEEGFSFTKHIKQ